MLFKISAVARIFRACLAKSLPKTEKFKLDVLEMLENPTFPVSYICTD